MLQSPPLLRLPSASVAVVKLIMLFSPPKTPNPSPHLTMNPSSQSSTPSSSLALLPNPSSPHFFRAVSEPRQFSVASSVSSATAVSGVEVGGEDSAVGGLVVISFYKFADFGDYAELRMPLKVLCEKLRVSGGIILAPEGINGSICGSREAVESVLDFIQSDIRLKGLRQIESPVTPEDKAIHHGHTSSSPVGAGEDAPFRWDHVRVKLKKEIVSLGMPSVSPIERVGKYVSPRDWNALIGDPDTVIIDVRNTYETRIGKFRGAVDPHTTAFRDFPTWVESELLPDGSDGSPCKVENDITKEYSKSQSDAQGGNQLPRVAMYCTGGIRCEKASSYLLNKGFKEVYHLEGGILKYLEEIPESESLWEGECFVFDKRVSVEHGLAQGTYKLCYGCKQPVSDQDMEAPEWEYGVCCPHCFSSKSEEEKERAKARQIQFETWGVIGGPDKGRRLTQSVDDSVAGDPVLSTSF